jgi:hypothetical protein
MVVEKESEVEIIIDSEPKPPRKNPKAKAPIRDAIKDRKIIGTSDKSMGPDKARSSDTGKLINKPERYMFLTTQTMLTLDETTLFYYTLSANKSNQKQSDVIQNWVETVARAKTINATTVTTSHASLKPKSWAIKREDAVLDIRDNGGLSDRDETEGAEQEAAVQSLPKNGKRATSSVSN